RAGGRHRVRCGRDGEAISALAEMKARGERERGKGKRNPRYMCAYLLAESSGTSAISFLFPLGQRLRCSSKNALLRAPCDWGRGWSKFSEARTSRRASPAARGS